MSLLPTTRSWRKWSNRWCWTRTWTC